MNEIISGYLLVPISHDRYPAASRCYSATLVYVRIDLEYIQAWTRIEWLPLCAVSALIALQIIRTLTYEVCQCDIFFVRGPRTNKVYTLIIPLLLSVLILGVLSSNNTGVDSFAHSILRSGFATSFDSASFLQLPMARITTNRLQWKFIDSNSYLNQIMLCWSFFPSP